MARILDVGCGTDPCRWFPGAELAEANWDGNERIHFPQFVSADEPLPIESGACEVVWYSYGWYLTADEDKAAIAKELSRVASPRATIILRDYKAVIDWETGVEKSISLGVWRSRLKKYFGPHGWMIESLWTRDHKGAVLCVLSRNW